MKIIKKSVKILFILMLVLAAGLAVLDIYLIKKPEMEAKRKIAGIETVAAGIDDLTINDHARIIGLGEAAHGNAEFQELKLDVLKVLTEKYGVSGFSLEEYVEVSRRLDGEDQVGMIELNISCPNVRHGGMSFGTDPACAAEVVGAVRRAVKKPLFVKLTPNVTDISEMARACEGEGADGVALINTLMGLRLDLRTRRPILANVTGGLSGPAVLPVALRMVYAVKKAVKIPVMGMGGVSTARDVIEMMLCGATAVQVGAANLVDPMACKRIIEDLPAEMDKLGIEKLSDIIGGAL